MGEIDSILCISSHALNHLDVNCNNGVTHVLPINKFCTWVNNSRNQENIHS